MSSQVPDIYRDEDGDRRESGGSAQIDLVRTLPILARLAAAAWWRAVGLTAEAYTGALRRAVRGAMDGQSTAQIIRGTEAELRDYVRELLGIVDADGDTPQTVVDAETVEDDDEPGTGGDDEPPRQRSLRERGAELLRRSADVDPYGEEIHPAFERILDQLTPDEGRILRLLALEGPQPSVDVRTGGALGMVKSDLVAPGLTMIGAEAGCMRRDRVHAYLNNLYRLGLVWFSREQIDEPQRYLVLEAQPDVVEAMEKADRGKTIRRSIHLTAFGADFCEACLPLDTSEIMDLHDHGDPEA